MNKKVLIFWLWFQWKKYVEYYRKKWYLVDWVTKSWLNKHNINWLHNIFQAEFLQEKEKSFYNKYNFIIIAISPNNEQDKIIKYFLNKDFKTKIIIEKPVSYNLELLNKLINKENYYFFIDEIVLSSYYKKIFKNNTNLTFETVIDNSNLEHIFWAFLLFSNFNDYLNNIKIVDNNINDNSKLFYNIKSNKFNLNCNKWIFKLNNRSFFNLNFWNSLEYVFSLWVNKNKLIKSNFLFLQKYLLENNKQGLMK